ncbi:MAG: KamA family radical SAM protein [Myxococcaceae bacterium]
MSLKTIKTIEELESYLTLTPVEKKAILTLSKSGGLPLQITPHYLSLIDPKNPNDPLRLQVIPQQAEFDPVDLERRDPLGEEDHEVVPHLVHRYPDRVLLLITDRCAAYCRFCTRKRWVGQGPTPKIEHFNQAINYLAEHTEIKEVIISGGDSLLISDDKIEKLLQKIKAIPSIEVVRFHTRMLTFSPKRITDQLVNILKKYPPVYIVGHFNHAQEISTETEIAISKLVENGICVLNQTVLLKNINNTQEILTNLFRRLTRLRVRPYYLHQCDIAPGTQQFRVPLEEALKLVQSLRGHISGLCLPTFVIDIPGGFGKVPLFPNPIVAQNSEFVTLEGFAGERAEYPAI